MRAALDELRPTDREVLLLRYEAGLPYGEVGSLLGLDEPTARQRVSRALVRLREIYGEEVL
jgi:RNA polymerase sigma-70 factor (ECF subfamily)